MNNKDLLKLWQDNGFVGSRKLYNIVKLGNPEVKFKDIDTFVKSQDTAQLHKVVRKKKAIHIMSPFPKYEVQIDLADMSNYSKENDGYKWILTVIDLFSKKVACEPVKSKSPKDVLEAMKKAFINIGYEPKLIRTDEGNEWR